LVRNKNTQEEGAILSDLLTECFEHKDNCFIAKECFDPSLYATFMKGDRLILDTSKKTEEGWLYGGVKRRSAKNEKNGHKLKRQDGFIHPFWVQRPAEFLGVIAFRIFGLFLMILDTSTDLMNGLDFFGFDKLILSDETICEDLQNYKHPIWGSVAIGLSWLPGLPVFIFQVTNTIANLNNDSTIKGSVLSFASALFTFIFWPSQAFACKVFILSG